MGTKLDTARNPGKIDNLAKMAAADINTCSIHSEQVIRQCADNLVRRELCLCAASVASIVDAVIDKDMRRLGSKNPD
jgi:hypothetical protein